MTFDLLYESALSLSPQGRVLLAEKILQSIGTNPVSLEWMEEIDRRIQEIENGEVETYTHEQVMRFIQENRGRKNQVSS